MILFIGMFLESGIKNYGFSDMSVTEHMKFYGKLKGIDSAEVEAYAGKMLGMMQVCSNISPQQNNLFLDEHR